MRERQSAQQGMIAQLRAATASGRVVLNLSPAANSLGAFPALEMEDNDQVMVPARPSTVSVMGMVYNAGSFVYEARRTVGDYLKLAGRGRADADMHHAFVLHADGSVTASTVVNGAFSGDRFSSLRMRPGDQIVVPSRVRSGGLLRGLRDWTQISSQLALTGAAVAILR
jgi:protein involved in polysaccharide export with SLBB domain